MPLAPTFSRLQTVDKYYDTILALPASDEREDLLGTMIEIRDVILSTAIRAQGENALLDPQFQTALRAHVSHALYAQALCLTLSGQELPEPLDAIIAINEVFDHNPDLIDAIAFN